MRIFIVNPVSGNGRGRKVWARVRQLLKYHRIPFQVYTAEHPGHATEIARSVARQTGVTAVVAVGGDGTVHEVGNGLIGSEVPLGYIPAGSGNDFALAQNIPFNPEQALKRVLRHRVKTIDTAAMDGRSMIGFAGIGFDGQVAEMVNRSALKRWMGRFSYIAGFIQTLQRFQPTDISLSVDGHWYEYENVWFVVIANIPNYAGGMIICPDARYDDGQLDICCVKNMSRSELLKMFPTVYRGAHVHHSSITVKRGTNIAITSLTPLTVHADGEVVGETPLSVKVSPKSLFIL